METLVFASFLLIQIAARAMPTMCSGISHLVFVQRIAKNHWFVWIAHPVVIHAVHDYAIHFVIYSGYIIHAH